MRRTPEPHRTSKGRGAKKRCSSRSPAKSAYDLNQHAELEEDGGRVIWLTYSRKTDRGWFGAEHVAWRVELTRGEGA